MDGARKASASPEMRGRVRRRTKHKSLFASFSSEKEGLLFFEKKNQKTFNSGAALPECVGVRRKFRLSTR
jgi:hypothetical protein